MENGDDKQYAPVETSVSADSGGGFSVDELDSEYGDGEQAEQVLNVSAESRAPSTSNNEFYNYKSEVRKQNCLFGSSVMSVAGLLIAAYFLMGLSFTPANIGIFGDETNMKGSSGEVGLEAANAEMQDIIDKEIIEAEQAGVIDEDGVIVEGHVAKRAKDKVKKRNKAADRFKNLIDKKNSVGANDWVEKKDWWKIHDRDFDTDQMSKEDRRAWKASIKKQKLMKRRCKKDPKLEECSNKDLITSLSDVRDKLVKHYNYEATGPGKESSPAPKDDANRGDHDNQKHDEKGSTVVVEPADILGAQDSTGEVQDEAETENADEQTVTKEEDDMEPAIKDENSIETHQDTDTDVVQSSTISDDFDVIKQVKHDSLSFTQGLSYGSNGKLYETTGLNGQSKVRIINPETFEVEKSIDLDRSFFGEGSAFFKDKDGNARLIEITWKSRVGWIYDADTLDVIKEFTYATTAPQHQGWGITYDPSNQEFIVSDGSPFLYFWDRDTLLETRKVSVTRFNGRSQDQLNELEFIDGLVCCNIWHVDEIICVDPESGKSVREYNMSELWPANQRGSSENVLNGIAVWKDHILLTGKRWDRMYLVTFPDWPGASDGVASDKVQQSLDEVDAEPDDSEPTTDVSPQSSDTAPLTYVDYEKLQWSELSDAARDAYGVLGATEKMWNGEEENPLDEYNWDDLTERQQEAAKTLGFDEQTWCTDEDGEWDCDEVEVPSSQADIPAPPSPIEPTQIQHARSSDYTVLQIVPHDPSSFTEGLSYGTDGKVYETTGNNGESKVMRINPETFEIEASKKLKRKFFGEGSTYFTDKDGNDRLIQITYQKQTGFIYDPETLEELSKFNFATTDPDNEGWGMTYIPDKKEFVVSDGSPFLYFWDRDTLKPTRSVTVHRFDGKEQANLNELEFMDGLVCMNIWYKDDIICVDPATGDSVREYDMSSLYPSEERESSDAILNGIALGSDHVLLTGKFWDRMYKVRFEDWPTLFLTK